MWFWLDYLHSLAPGVVGNKARKFAALRRLLDQRRPAAVHMYGGCQSNAMLAAAHLCAQADVEFVYHTASVPQRALGAGNFTAARALGMRVVERPQEAAAAWVQALEARPVGPDGVWALEDGGIALPRGGACGLAQAGVQELAQQVAAAAAGRRSVTLAVPCGTGTHACVALRARDAAGPERRVGAMPSRHHGPVPAQTLAGACGGAGAACRGLTAVPATPTELLGRCYWCVL